MGRYTCQQAYATRSGPYSKQVSDMGGQPMALILYEVLSLGTCFGRHPTLERMGDFCYNPVFTLLEISTSMQEYAHKFRVVLPSIIIFLVPLWRAQPSREVESYVQSRQDKDGQEEQQTFAVSNWRILPSLKYSVLRRSDPLCQYHSPQDCIASSMDWL